MSDNLKSKMIGAVTWTSIDRFGQQAVQFVVGIILARLISPSDYGLIAMIMIFITLSTLLVDSGFGQALVRKQDADETDYNSIFYFNVAVSIVLYIILYFSAPLISNYFDEPQLVKITRVVFIVILFNALYLIPINKLLHNLDFKGSAIINIISVACSGIVSLILAFNHFGVWALVFQQLLFHFFRMIGLNIYTKWKPKAMFSFRVIKELGSFSVHLLGTYILNAVFNYIYIIIIGKTYSKYEAGLYNQANKLNETTNSTFQSILVSSTYSLLVKIQNEDERFRRVFRGISSKISLVTFPFMLMLFSIAHALIFVLYSNVWIKSVPYFQLLTLSVIFMPLYGLNINALNARGKSKTTFRIELVKKGLILISIFICYHWGILAMLAGYIVSNYISFGISMIYLKKDLNHFYKHQITDFFGCLAIGIVIVAVNVLLSFLIGNNYVLLAVQVLASAAVYLVCVRIFYQDDFYSALKFVKGKWNSFIHRKI